MPLPGIRLDDLYNSADYNKWIGDSTNVKLVDSTIRNNRHSDPDKIRGHLYMNSKIKEDFGEEVFNSLPNNMRLDQKIDWYNSNLPEEQVEEEPFVDESPAVLDSTNNWGEPVNNSGFYKKPEILNDADLVPKSEDGHAMWNWFQKKSDGASDRAYQEYLNSHRPKSNEPQVVDPLAANSETTKLAKQLEKMKAEEPNNAMGIKLLQNQLNVALENQEIANDEAATRASNNLNDFRFVFDNVNSSKYLPINRDLWGSANTENTVNDLTAELRDKMEMSPQFAFSAFEQFDRLAYEMIPQYRNYHDTDAMPITPNEMKDIMAQYYSIRTLKDLNEANNFAQSALQSVLASHQSILDKSGVAIEQAVQDFTGNLAATIGIVCNTPYAIWQASQKDLDVEDLSGFKEFLFYAVQNPITEWGNNLQTTGTWLPDMQERFKELEYNQWQLQRAAGDETKFWDINTPFELFAQGAYTLAGMATGTAAAQVLNGTIGAASSQLATKILTDGAAKLGTRFAARAISTLGGAIATGATAYLPAAAEASMDAVEKANLVKTGAEDDILRGIEDELQKDLQDGTFEKWYEANSRLPLLMPPAEGWKPGELEAQVQLRNQERSYLWEEYRNMKVQEVLNDPNIQREIEQEAFRTGAKTMFDEATWIAFGDMFFSNILGRSFRELKRGVVRGVTGQSYTPYKWVVEGNYYKAVPRDITAWQKLGAIGKGLFESVEEGVEELFQTVDSQMREDLAHSYLEDYVANRYDPDALAQLSDSFRENWEVTKKSIGENILSEEALYSFLLGAVSAGIGSPTVLQGIRTSRDAKRKGEKATFWDFWRNPIAENLQDLKTRQIESAKEAEDINRWLQEHPEIATYNDETAILKFLAQKEDAARRNDEVSYRDALMGQKVATLLMMDRVRPNGMKLNLHARLKELANLDANSQEARAVVDQILRDDDSIIRTTEGPLNEEELAVLDKAKQRAQEDINTYRNVKAQMRILDSQFGNAISQESKEALAYGMIMHENWGKRIEDIIKSAKESYTEANPENQVTTISQEDSEAKNAIARYGNIKAIDDEYNALIAQRTRLRANKKRLYKYEYKTELAKNTKQIQENRAARRALEGKENTTVSASEILNLSNKAMAYLLDESNRKSYSEAQQKEIEKFINSDGINGQVLTDLKDAGRIQNNMDYFKDEYSRLLDSNGTLIPLFDREIRARASERWSRARLESALDATTYEQFRDEMDKALATGDFTGEDKAQFQRIFSDPNNPNKETSKFFDLYKKEELNRAQVRRIMENSPAYQALSTSQKKVASEVISDSQLSREPLTTQNIIDRLNDPKFAETLTREELEQLAKALDNVMRQKESYDKAVAAEKARQEKLAKAKMAEDAARRTPAAQKEQSTIINNKKYQANKTFFDTIFSKVASIFTSRDAEKLSKEEFINLMGLYTEEPLSADIMGEDFDTSLTLTNLGNIVKNLLKTVENAAYLNPKISENAQYQNTMQLISTLKGLIQAVNQSYKTDSPFDLNSLLRNSIVQINPTMTASFKTKKVELPRRLERFSSKKFAALGTQAEKGWYNDNDIEGNLAKVAALRAHKQRYAFIKDESLAEAVRQELGIEEFTDDNLPVIIAAKVKEGTEGAVKLEDGNYYLYVGLLQDSRLSAGVYDRNELNALRSNALEQEGSGPIKSNGKVYISEGAIIKYTNKSEDTVETDSLKTWLLDKYKGNKEAAKKDFIEHFRGLNATINQETGEVSGSIEWKGKRINISFVTNARGRSSYKYAVYLLEKPDGTVDPKILFVRDLDEFNFDESLGVANLFEALDGPLLTDKKYQQVKELDFIRRTINYIYTRGISSNLTALSSARADVRNAGLQKINEAVNKYLSRRFNFKKSARNSPEFQLEVTLKDNNLEYRAYQLTDTGKTPYQGIPEVLATLPIEDTKSPEAIIRFIQESLKNLIFDEDGALRRDGEGNPLVKLEVNYREAEKSESTKRVFDPDKVEDLLLANAWKLMDVNMNPTPESIDVNPTVQGGKSATSKTGNVVQDAMDAITQPEFIDTHEGKHFEVGPNEIEVTTFIHGDEEVPDTDSIAGQMARNLGTSVDKLYRVWREKQTVEGVIEYMKSRNLGSWVGLSRLDIPVMCAQFERIEKFFQSRQEVPVPKDLIFKGRIYVDGKTHYFIGKPDIITIDKNGKYHIYDMKSFRYQAGVSREAPGFNSTTFVINGLRDFDRKYSSWQQQMSIYKFIIESKLGKDTVASEFGVIPIRLGYAPNGSIGNEKEAIGAKEVKDSDGRALHLSFADVSLEAAPNKQKEKATRCYDDAIRIPAILDVTTINPTGWKQMSKADELKSTFGKVQEEKIDVKDEAKPVVEADSAPPDTRPISSLTADDIAGDLAGDSTGPSIEDLLTGACDNL